MEIIKNPCPDCWIGLFFWVDVGTNWVYNEPMG